MSLFREYAHARTHREFIFLEKNGVTVQEMTRVTTEGSFMFRRAKASGV